MGTSDLPEIYAQALRLHPRTFAYISEKSQMPMLQLIIFHLGDSPASVHGICRNAL